MPATTQSEIAIPKIVSREEWLTERKKHLSNEKELTRRRDHLNAERRRLPMVELDKHYAFDGREENRACRTFSKAAAS